MLTVWIDSWQMQCCGTPFSVDSHISWTLGSDPDLAFLRSVLGVELAASITHREDHHGGLPDGSPETRGLVRSIRAMFCTYAPGDRPRFRYPVSGSTVAATRTTADGREPESEGQSFVGYVVELDSSE